MSREASRRQIFPLLQGFAPSFVPQKPFLFDALSGLHDSPASLVSGNPFLLHCLFKLHIIIGARLRGEREATQTAQGVLGMKGVSSPSCESCLTQTARGQWMEVIFGRTDCLCSCADIVRSNLQGRYIWTDRSTFAIVRKMLANI